MSPTITCCQTKLEKPLTDLKTARYLSKNKLHLSKISVLTLNNYTPILPFIALSKKLQWESHLVSTLIFYFTIKLMKLLSSSMTKITLQLSAINDQKTSFEISTTFFKSKKSAILRFMPRKVKKQQYCYSYCKQKKIRKTGGRKKLDLNAKKKNLYSHRNI